MKNEDVLHIILMNIEFQTNQTQKKYGYLFSALAYKVNQGNCEQTTSYLKKSPLHFTNYTNNWKSSQIFLHK